jgi:small subunit ribosomal protein S15
MFHSKKKSHVERRIDSALQPFSVVPVFFSTPSPIPSSSSCSSSSSFHTSSLTQESKRKIVARQKKQKNLALRAERDRQDVQDLVDPITGDLRPSALSGGFFARQGQNPTESSEGNKYEKSLLKKVVLERDEIWFSQPPQYTSSSQPSFPPSIQPTHFNHLSSETDRDFLLKDLPETHLAHTPAGAQSLRGTVPSATDQQAYEEDSAQEGKMSEQVMRVLDLRNADAKGIRRENIRRIVEVFGGDLNEVVPSSSSGSAEPRMNTGHPTVTSAILTHRIHLLSNHMAQNPRDVHNKKHLRELVHQRAKILKYYKQRVGRKGGEGEGAYLGLLEKLGLDRRAVEGELIVR